MRGVTSSLPDVARIGLDTDNTCSGVPVRQVGDRQADVGTKIPDQARPLTGRGTVIPANEGSHSGDGIGRSIPESDLAIADGANPHAPLALRSAREGDSCDGDCSERRP